MNCDAYTDLYELYSLGLLEGKERCEMEEHLAEGCPNCEAGVRRALEVNALISASVPLVDPPARLRSRILRSFPQEPDRFTTSVIPKPAHRRPAAAWLAFAASLLVIGGLIWRIQYQNGRSAAQNRQVAEVARILQAPESRTISFGSENAHGPYGRVFVNPALGVVITASSLPAAPAGWSYVSWIVPKNGSPRPVGPVPPHGTGQVLTLIPGPIDASTTAAVALSLEPPGATLEKPTKVLFAAPV
jgi:anti-sigma-K factor RskA